jgi:hypothetical protein
MSVMQLVSLLLAVALGINLGVMLMALISARDSKSDWTSGAAYQDTNPSKALRSDPTQKS